MQVIVSEIGIRWTWYFHYVTIDGHAKCVKTWRAHRFEDVGYKPPQSEITPNARRLVGQVNIAKWKEDGKPGGVAGLRANYRIPDILKVGLSPYLIIS